MPHFTAAHHMGLTVRDRKESSAWYQRVLGFQFVKEFDTGIPRLLLQHVESHFHISLYNHAEQSGDRFNPMRTGLDHLALAVPDDDQLHAWIAHLDEVGVDHSEVHELGHARFVSLEDPDGVQIELWVTITPFHPAE